MSRADAPRTPAGPGVAARDLLPRPRFAELAPRTVVRGSVQERLDSRLPAQGYELRIDADAIELRASDAAGLFYGRATLEQLTRIHAGRVPTGIVRDHPDLPVRAVMLDISRDKVPTLETLFAIVARLSEWKINQLQLYSEHTFAYRGHAVVHAASSPLGAEEIRSLDAFCARHHVELVPNQNCLGHMNRWLRHERYCDLALEPDGFVDPYGMCRPPMTLDPRQPRSLGLVRELLAELLPCFGSRRVHVGLDETWEIPRERLGDFMSWIDRLRTLPELHGREMLMWGDMLGGDPDLLRRLPAGVTVCEWGYESTHPFAERSAAIAASGVPFWVAPGTSSWLTILGRVSNATANCRRAAEAALAHGAAGYLVTDWGDQGHLQQLPISEPALAYAAGVAWCLDANRDLDLARALSLHSFADETGELACALLALGDAYLAVGPQYANQSTLVQHLYFPQVRVGHDFTRGLRCEELDRVHDVLDEARGRLARAAPRRCDAEAILAELCWSIDLVALLADDAKERLAGDGSLGSVPASVRRHLAERLRPLDERYRELWLRRNRPGGLDDSVAWLQNLCSAYESGQPDPTWGGLRLRT